MSHPPNNFAQVNTNTWQQQQANIIPWRFPNNLPAQRGCLAQGWTAQQQQVPSNNTFGNLPSLLQQPSLQGFRPPLLPNLKPEKIVASKKKKTYKRPPSTPASRKKDAERKARERAAKKNLKKSPLQPASKATSPQPAVPYNDKSRIEPRMPPPPTMPSPFTGAGESKHAATVVPEPQDATAGEENQAAGDTNLATGNQAATIPFIAGQSQPSENNEIEKKNESEAEIKELEIKKLRDELQGAKERIDHLEITVSVLTTSNQQVVVRRETDRANDKETEEKQKQQKEEWEAKIKEHEEKVGCLEKTVSFQYRVISDKDRVIKELRERIDHLEQVVRRDTDQAHDKENERETRTIEHQVNDHLAKKLDNLAETQANQAIKMKQLTRVINYNSKCLRFTQADVERNTKSLKRRRILEADETDSGPLT